MDYDDWAARIAEAGSPPVVIPGQLTVEDAGRCEDCWASPCECPPDDEAA